MTCETVSNFQLVYVRRFSMVFRNFFSGTCCRFPVFVDPQKSPATGRHACWVNHLLSMILYVSPCSFLGLTRPLMLKKIYGFVLFSWSPHFQDVQLDIFSRISYRKCQWIKNYKLIQDPVPYFLRRWYNFNGSPWNHHFTSPATSAWSFGLCMVRHLSLARKVHDARVGVHIRTWPQCMPASDFLKVPTCIWAKFLVYLYVYTMWVCILRFAV